MMSECRNEFAPDWASPPGDSIADALEGHGWTVAEFAQRLGCSIEQVSQLLCGKAPIEEETAQRLAGVLGAPARFWLTCEAHYCARVGIDRPL